jgi:hypothetical protein
MRAGRTAEAIVELQEAALLSVCQDDPDAIPPAYAWYLLAIANSQSGDHDVARQWHEKAKHWTREQMDVPSPAVIRWSRRLTLQLLQREAETLLKQEVEAET